MTTPESSDAELIALVRGGKVGAYGTLYLQEFRDSGHLHALAIEKPKRRQPVAGLIHPADPGHLQPRNIPDRRAVLCHPYLRAGRRDRRPR